MIDTFSSLLEVGALKPDNYASCSPWITTTPIDLRSRHPSIIEQDFLAMDVNEHAEKWDLVSLSLVVNFVPEPKDRGNAFLMACLAALNIGRTHARTGTRIPAPVWPALSRCGFVGAHTAVGSLGLQLPLPCVENSRYMSSAHLASLMAAVGFVEVEWREGRKMAYWLYRKTGPGLGGDEFRMKRVCRVGRRNNFCILLA